MATRVTGCLQTFSAVIEVFVKPRTIKDTNLNQNSYKMTNKMQLCRIRLLFLCSLAAVHVSSVVGCCQQPTTIHLNKTTSCIYSLYAPDDERQHRSKHVEHPRNKGITNVFYRVASCWSFYKNCVMMHGTMNLDQNVTMSSVLIEMR